MTKILVLEYGSIRTIISVSSKTLEGATIFHQRLRTLPLLIVMLIMTLESLCSHSTRNMLHT